MDYQPFSRSWAMTYVVVTTGKRSGVDGNQNIGRERWATAVHSSEGGFEGIWFATFCNRPM